NAESLFFLQPPNKQLLNGQTRRIQLWGRGLPAYTFDRGPLQGLELNGCLVAVVFIWVIGLVISLDFWNDAQTQDREYELTQSGKSIEAEVTGRNTTTSDEGHVTYFVSFRYRVNDREYELRDTTTQTRYDQAEKGASIRIRYDPDDPEFARLEDHAPAPRQLLSLGYKIFWVVWGLLVVPLLVLGFWPEIRQRFRHRRLRRKGYLLPGTAVRLDHHRSENGPQVARLRYRFTTPSGTQIEARTAQVSCLLRTGPVTRIEGGETVMVLYVHDRLHTVL
ncbi:MAG: DUF3592 domain-containing protein, partial [Chloroflexi bacterium]|nr:DUF3592 domain-containing protein [Chloroflexota bacterium]